MNSDRRQDDGLAVVTTAACSGVLKARCTAIGLRTRVVPVQDGGQWPNVRPPVVLDTRGISEADLLTLLVRTPGAPIFALAAPDQRRVLTMLSLTPEIHLICADVTVLPRWLPYLCTTLPSTRPHPLWLIPPPFMPPLDPLLLPVLAVLRHSPSYAAALSICGLSKSSLLRLLRSARVSLQLPPGDVTRFRPAMLAARMIDRLGDDLMHPPVDLGYGITKPTTHT